MRRSLRWLTATAVVALVFVALPAASLAASAPAIEWTSAWNLAPNDATVGAGIDPEGLPDGVYYQFQVVANPSEYVSEIACPPRAELKGTDGCMGPEVEGVLPIGSLPSGAKGETVTLDLAGAGVALKPGTTYHYRVLAAKALVSEDTLEWEPPTVIGPDQTFTTPLASAPTVESESFSHLTQYGATLEATINSEDLPEGAYYQFQVVKSTSEYLPELSCPEPLPPPHGDDADCGSPDSGPHTPGALPIGYIEKGPAGQSVSLGLVAAGMTLQPGTTYHYRVLTAKRVQSEDGVDWQGPFAAGPDHTFTTFPAGSAPAIESVSISHLTATDATLQARIDTEGLSTTYQFDMWSSPCSKHGDGCELLMKIPLPSGLILGSFVGQTVSLDLNAVGITLGGGEYGYSVTATSTGGSTQGPWQQFEAPVAVVEPLGSATAPQATAPQSGGGQPATSSDGDQAAGSGRTSSTAPPGRASNPLDVSKTGTPKRGGERKHKAKHHHKKLGRHPAQVKKHKR